MKILFGYIIVYFVIGFASIFISHCVKEKTDKTIPVAIMAIIITLYIFGIINLLYPGVITICIISTILGVYTIVKNIKDNTIKDLKERIVTKGSLFFTIIFFVFAIVTLARELTNWDQFSYWSFATKDMFFTNKMLLSTDIGIQYPPMPAILQYFFMKVIGEYFQGIEIFTVWIFSFSFFLPLFSRTSGKKLSTIVVCIVSICIPAVFSMLIFYESSYPDALLGIMIGYLSYLYFLEEEDKLRILNIVFSLLVITLTKPIGIVISIILLITFLLDEILQNKDRKKENIKKLIIYLCIIIAVYMSWIIYLNINIAREKVDITQKNEFEKIAQSILTTIFGTCYDNNDAAKSNGKLLEKLYAVEEISTPVKINAGGLISIFLILMVLYYYKIKKERNIRNTVISVLTGLILYIIALQLAYIAKFPVKEMLKHDGMERYIATYLLGILYFIVNVWLDMCKEKDSNYYYMILACIIIAITPISSVANASITSGIYNINSISYCNMGRHRAEEILEELHENQKVLGVCQNESIRLINLMVRFYMYPANYKVANKIQETNSLKDILAKEKYDYIYVISEDDYLKKELKDLYNIENIEKNKLYKLEKR